MRESIPVGITGNQVTMNQIDRIRKKLALLRESDKDLTLFGADTHKYELYPPLLTEKLRQFEKANGVELPEQYFQFLTEVGNGGAGPFYGLLPIETGHILFYDDSEAAAHTFYDLSKSFPYTEPWNVTDELTELYEQIEAAVESGNVELEEALCDKKYDLISAPENDYGRIEISDYGCGTRITLVVNGEAKGEVWTDDRTNDGGIYPSIELGNEGKLGFFDWYEKWLDNSLKETNAVVE